MGIADLFRPKWKHSKASVRAQALRGMRSSQRDLVLDMARHDPDADLRVAALHKLGDPDVLRELAQAESEASVAEAARARAHAILLERATSDALAVARPALDALRGDADMALVAQKAQLPGIVERAVERIEQQKTLGELVRAADEANLRLRALSRIEGEGALQGFVLGCEHKEVVHAALERIDDPQRLEQIIQRCRSKSLRARAKRKLDGLCAEETQGRQKLEAARKAERAEQARLLAEIESIVVEKNWRSTGEVATLRAAWAKRDAIDEAFDLRFRHASQAFDRGREEFVEASARAETVPEQPVVELPEEATASQPAADSAAARVDPEPRADAAASLAIELARDGVSTAPPPLAAAERAAGARKQADRAARAESKAAESARRQRERERWRSDMTELCDALAEAVETSPSCKDAESLLARAGEHYGRRRASDADFSEVDDTLVARYLECSGQLHTWVREQIETEQWRSWAQVTELQKLVELAGVLNARADEAEDLGAELKRLQAAWKDVKGVPRAKNEELWQQFKPICDEIYEKVKLRRAQRDLQVEANLEKKTRLCEQAETLAAATELAVAVDRVKHLQREWKEIGIISHGREKQVWTRFRSACDQVFDRRREQFEARKSEESNNLSQKSALIDKLEGLLAEIRDEDSWKRATAEVKAAQRRWRDIGHVPRKHVDEIHTRFRGVCDRIFGRLESLAEDEREAEAAERAARIAALQEAWSAPELEAARAVELWSETRACDAAELEQKARGRLCAMLEDDSTVFAGTELDPEASLRRKSKLCAKLRTQAPASDLASGPNLDDDGPSIKEQLEAALQSNALGGGELAQGERARELAAARAAWARIGPTPGEAGTAQDREFEALVQTLERASD